MTPMLLLSLALAGQTTPFPAHDGFVYPGQAGSDGIAAYDQTWNAYVAALPSRGLSQLHDADWMSGTWQITLRDYDIAGGKMVSSGTGTATISVTGDGRWLDIASEAGVWSSHRYLGYDTISRRWVMEMVMAPGVAYEGELTGAAWKDGRLVLGPAVLDFHGLKSTDRVTIVRDSDDQFRIVTETLVSGGFVAVDDVLFDRAQPK